MKEWVKLFQKYDLYTKSNSKIDEIKAKEYYDILIKKYFPDKIYW